VLEVCQGAADRLGQRRDGSCQECATGRELTRDYSVAVEDRDHGGSAQVSKSLRGRLPDAVDVGEQKFALVVVPEVGERFLSLADRLKGMKPDEDQRPCVFAVAAVEVDGASYAPQWHWVRKQ